MYWFANNWFEGHLTVKNDRKLIWLAKFNLYLLKLIMNKTTSIWTQILVISLFFTNYIKTIGAKL